MAGQRWPCASAPVLKRIQTEALQGRKIIAQGASPVESERATESPGTGRNSPRVDGDHFFPLLSSQTAASRFATEHMGRHPPYFLGA